MFQASNLIMDWKQTERERERIVSSTLNLIPLMKPFLILITINSGGHCRVLALFSRLNFR